MLTKSREDINLDSFPPDKNNKTEYKPASLVACINDISGYGRCSLTIALPVLSVLGVQCCPVPTAVLSCHTGFDKFFFKDMTDCMSDYLGDWNDKGIVFDAVYSGFLGSLSQIKITENFIRQQKNSPLCLVDPVMGDNGSIYSTYTEKMCEEMKRLVSVADVITPNITESCILTGTDYCGEELSTDKAKEIMKKLEAMGCSSAVITGIQKGNELVNLVLENSEISEVSTSKARSYSGTGDLFASVVMGKLLRGSNLCDSVYTASAFIKDVLDYTVLCGVQGMGGVQFEPLLYRLGDRYYEKIKA